MNKTVFFVLIALASIAGQGCERELNTDDAFQAADAISKGESIDILEFENTVGLAPAGSEELGDVEPMDGDNTRISVTCGGPGNINCCSDDADCIYMSRWGSDTNYGTNETNDAVRTLARVMFLINTSEMDRHIEVRIKRGTYTSDFINWKKYHNTYQIRFMPSDYKWGGWGSFEGRPKFYGNGLNEYWFYLDGGNGGDSNLRFYYLEVRNYAKGGLGFAGLGPWESNANNYVYGMYFKNIGGIASTYRFGYAGVALTHSHRNTIENNHFINIINDKPDEEGLIHAVYMNNARSNLIQSNNIVDVSGDAIRVRNDSNWNIIQRNTITRSGSHGHYGDWYNDPPPGVVCTNVDHTGSQECPSWENWFRYNTLGCGYDGQPLPHFHFYHERYCVPTGCPDYFWVWKRLETASNTDACP
ncbi:MAG: right-handed parallel beta-helix repeat-containing protein [Myxococcota bacterium]|nr:right-handed parallel beta-helix repeat-containing protein [Myxococcota bacterium]